MASMATFRVLPNSAVDVIREPRFQMVHILACRKPKMVLSDSIVSSAVFGDKQSAAESLSAEENGHSCSEVVEKRKNGAKICAYKELQALYDDGFGSGNVKDYLEVFLGTLKPDGGPPRWFCPPECGRPVTDAPTLLFLPWLDGVGLGLILHQKTLGKAFEVRCLHIPANDRTSFEGLVKIVEESVRLEHDLSPNKPVYLVGDSFGGCLALAVAARNPTVDMVVILANPATSFSRSQLHLLLLVLEGLPGGLRVTIHHLLSIVMGDPLKMLTVNTENRHPHLVLEELSSNFSELFKRFLSLFETVPEDSLLWKLKLLKTAAAYTNSRLHAVKAEVLVLASGKDDLFPSRDEARRLASSLKNCRIRNFEENGHNLLLEDGINLMTVIKATCLYRRSSMHDYVSDYFPPSISEHTHTFDQQLRSFHTAISPVMFSTKEDGTIVKGLSGVPSEGPVLLIGYHMIMGLEIYSIVEQFLKQKNIIVRSVAHPLLFTGMSEHSDVNALITDSMKVFGALPVTPTNLYKILEANSHILLYPGGAREALHNKDEQYKLFWPEQPEFIRMAARFGATIVPFAPVGEDDIAEIFLDCNDMMKIPILSDHIKEQSRGAIISRPGMKDEVANQTIFLPGLLPKVPGRVYCLFGKPVQTKGNEEILKHKEAANELYAQIRSDVESNVTYLLKKREQDPYRGILDRMLYRAIYGSQSEVPTFEP